MSSKRENPEMLAVRTPHPLHLTVTQTRCRRDLCQEEKALIPAEPASGEKVKPPLRQ